MLRDLQCFCGLFWDMWDGIATMGGSCSLQHASLYAAARWWQLPATYTWRNLLTGLKAPLSMSGSRSLASGLGLWLKVLAS